MVETVTGLCDGGSGGAIASAWEKYRSGGIQGNGAPSFTSGESGGACYELGAAFHSGTDGLPKNVALASSLFAKSCEAEGSSSSVRSLQNEGKACLRLAAANTARCEGATSHYVDRAQAAADYQAYKANFAAECRKTSGSD
jgi:hypothetical protein